MPSPRMRPAFIPRVPSGSPYPRFVACNQSIAFRAAVAPGFIQMAVQKQPEAVSPENNEAERAFWPWQEKFRKAIEKVVDEETERSERAMRCAERVYRNAWFELWESQQELLNITRRTATAKQQAFETAAKLQDAENQALLLRMISGFKPAWEIISSQAQDPFSGEFRGEVSRDWLDEWYNAHEDDPYPTVDDKERLATMTGLTTKQVDYWFWNKRKREKKAKKLGNEKRVHKPEELPLK